MSEFDNFTGPAELPGDLIGIPGVCNYAISLTGLLNGHKWEDGETGAYTYKVISGAITKPVRQKVTITVLKHEKGPNGKAKVQIDHRVIPFRQFGETERDGHLNGRVYEFGPNDSLTFLPGKKKLIHGKHIRMRPARDLTPRR